MAKAKSTFGDYTSVALFDVIETAANTLIFERLESGTSIYDKVAWIIERIELAHRFENIIGLAAAGDGVVCGLTLSNQIVAADFSIDNPAIIWAQSFQTGNGVAAQDGFFHPLNFNYDYTGLSGGGIMILPQPLYFGVVGVAASNVCGFTCKLYYHAIELQDADYFSLVQSRQLLVSQ